MRSSTTTALLRAAGVAGKIMLDHFDEPGLVQSELKADQTPVTEADIRIDKRVTEIYLETFPGAGIIREEGKNINEDAPLRFTIDGVDGTGEFARGGTATVFATACEVSGVVSHAAIHAPLLPTPLTFLAVKGGGAELNGRQLHVSEVSDIFKHPVVEIATAPSGSPHGFTHQMFRLAHDLQDRGFMVNTVRSISYSNAMIAAGEIVGVIFPWGSLWDVMPGDLMVREAGGRTSDLLGNPLSYRNGSTDGMVSSNGHFHDLLLEIVKEHYRNHA